MNQQSPSSVLAAYATLKSLSDENKYQSPYQILREFIRYIIISDALYSFSAIEMKNRLTEHFGFLIPEAVVKSSLGNMKGILLDHGTYTVCTAELGSDSLFEDKKKEADDYESRIIQMLSEYISKRTPSANIDEVVLSQELARFLTDDTSLHSTKYTDFIGEFVLKNENNKAVQDGLNKIREGSILYLGLCHNIGEVGSLKKPLTLYLGTEILFGLAGYNGEIYQQFANDFYDQVRSVNSGKSRKIALYYFSDIKKEIDEYFKIASEIVEGKRHSLLDKPAMKAITDGCSTAADIDVKKSDFYYLLQYSYGITEDPKDNYYDEEYFSSNLESFEYEDEADKNKKKELAIKLISHINKLRNGKRYHSDIESEHLIVTNTKAILLISKEQAENIKANESLDHICNFAVSLDRITSLLWYKLGNGFSKKAYPTSVKAIIKARVVLSASIAKKAEKAFTELKQQYENNTITENQVAARIITIKQKPILPEDLQGDDIDEIMNFSPEYLSRYEEQFKNNQNALKEKEKVIQSLKADAEKAISEKEATIVSQQSIIKEKDDENSQLRDQLREYQRRDEMRANRKANWKKIGKLVWNIVWKLAVIAIPTAIVVLLDKKYNFQIPPIVYTIVDTLGLTIAFGKNVKNAAEKCFVKEKQSKADK